MPDCALTQDILIVEDNDDDFEAVERALTRQRQVANPIRRFRDGEEVWNYLTGNGKFSDTGVPRHPGLVLLDLNMPGIDGRQVLARIRSNHDLARIPVVIMTTSVDERDVEDCYAEGANTYLRKPVSWTEFSETVGQLYDYWFRFALRPK
ncbi:MAG: two-component system response regulator [Rhodobacteraceae bacterium]|nr:two-component system response regulator [Paracoccaceae bacterium]MAY48110.1 two-component system response regulator [Paracoccaceae bacterium]QEW21949.1 Response regulator rcp1 [Marinibacterium anthonyi]